MHRNLYPATVFSTKSIMHLKKRKSYWINSWLQCIRSNCIEENSNITQSHRCPATVFWTKNIMQMVRSTLLQVTGGRQSGQRGFLLLAVRWPLWSKLSMANLNQMNHSWFGSPWFLMLFPIVSLIFLCDTGNIRNNGTLWKIMKTCWKIDVHNINSGSFR